MTRLRRARSARQDSLYIFCVNYAGQPAAFQDAALYSFKIYEGDVLVRNFVPCCPTKSPDISVSVKAYGRLYDTVEGVFYENQSSTGSLGVNNDASVKYLEWNPDDNIEMEKECPYGSWYLITEDTQTLDDSDHIYVVRGNVKINHGLVCKNRNVSIILTDGSRLEIQAENYEAGIRVEWGNPDYKLHIYGQTLGTGTLIARGGLHSAGIGGGSRSTDMGTLDLCGTFDILAGTTAADATPTTAYNGEFYVKLTATDRRRRDRPHKTPKKWALRRVCPRRFHSCHQKTMKLTYNIDRVVDANAKAAAAREKIAIAEGEPSVGR